jgi:hypothetical protein
VHRWDARGPTPIWNDDPTSRCLVWPPTSEISPVGRKSVLWSKRANVISAPAPQFQPGACGWFHAPATLRCGKQNCVVFDAGAPSKPPPIDTWSSMPNARGTMIEPPWIRRVLFVAGLPKSMGVQAVAWSSGS